MKVINATGLSKITRYLQEEGYNCIETTEIYDTKIPVITNNENDPTGESANILAKSTPVLFLTWKEIKGLHPNVHVIIREEVHIEDIVAWLELVKLKKIGNEQMTRLSVKKSVVVYPIQTGVGSAFISRMLALESAKHRNTVLVEANYRYPKSLYYLGLSQAGLSLNNYIEKLLNDDSDNLSQYILNKKMITNITKERKTFLKQIPENLFLLAPDAMKSYEHFPEMPCELEKSKGLTERMLQHLKQQHDSVIINTLSDLDDCLTLSLLNTSDIKIIVADASPPSILSLEQKIDNLKMKELINKGDKIIINKCHQDMEKQLSARLTDYDCLFLPYNLETDLNMNYGKLSLEEGTIKDKIQELESFIFGTEIFKKQKTIFNLFRKDA